MVVLKLLSLVAFILGWCYILGELQELALSPSKVCADSRILNTFRCSISRLLALLEVNLRLIGLFKCDRCVIKQEYSIIFPFFASTIIAIGYVATLLGILKYFFYFTYLTGIVLFVYYVTIAFIKKRLKEDCFPPEVCVFLLVLLLVYLRFFNAYMYKYWDDLGHWALVVKEMVIFDGIAPSDKTLVLSQDYPNGSAIFHYFVNKILGHSEGHGLFSNALLHMLFFSVLLSRTSFARGLLLLVSALLMAFAYKHGGIGSLYVDTLIGAMFGALLVMYISIKDKTTGLLMMLPIVFALVCIKQTGFILAYLCIGIMVLHALLLRDVRRQITKGQVVIILLMCMLPYVVEQSWVVYTDHYMSKTLLSKLESFLLHIKEPRYFDVVIHFYGRTVLLLLRVASVISVFLILLSYLFLKAHKLLSRDKKIFFWLLLGGFVVFLHHRLFLYVSVFSYDEAISGASQDRYLPTYIVGIVVVMLWYLKHASERLKYKYLLWKNDVRRYGALMLCVVVALVVIRKDPPLLPYDRLRKSVSDDVAEIRSELSKNKNIYIVFHNVKQFECKAYRYELVNQVKRDVLSLCAGSGNRKDVQKIDIKFLEKHFSVNDFNIDGEKEDPSKYDVLYIPRADDDLWRVLSRVINVRQEDRKHKKFVRKRGIEFVAMYILS